MNSKKIIELLNLTPLPEEGGFYRETFRADNRFTIKNNENPLKNSIYTSIYYLLTDNTFSHLHKLPFDEIYHFYMGESVSMLLLFPDGKIEKIILGNKLDKGEIVQFRVPAGVWQGSILKDNGEYALLGTTMSPGFDFSDYIHGNKDELIKKYPNAKTEILKLTK